MHALGWFGEDRNEMSTKILYQGRQVFIARMTGTSDHHHHHQFEQYWIDQLDRNGYNTKLIHSLYKFEQITTGI